jgi:hypothetical protein
MLQQQQSDARTELPAPSSPYWCDQTQCILSNFSETAINEFVRLVTSEFYDQAADVFTGPARPERDLILPHLADISELDRRRFSDVLHARGYDVNVPGIAPKVISESAPKPSSRVDGVDGSVSPRPFFTIP